MLSLNKYLKAHKLFIVICVLLFKNVYYAQNIIQNSSFELYTNPLNCYGGFDNYNATPVYHVVDNWYTLNSSDYFNETCASSTFFSPQQNLFGKQSAKIGIAYPGFILFAANYETKEYIYQQLSSPLQAGRIYCLSFYVSRADRVTHAIHSIGAHFSNSIQSAAALGYVNVIPQVVNQNGFITDTIGWTQIQGCFTANGGEQFLTIGNFNSNSNTDTLFVGSNDPEPSAYKYAYYYIDDITLIDQSTVGIIDLDKDNGFSVYPNPANDVLNIFDEQGQFKNANIEIKNYLGQIVFADNFNLQIDIHSFSVGMYFLTIKDKGIAKTIKFIKE